MNITIRIERLWSIQGKECRDSAEAQIEGADGEPEPLHVQVWNVADVLTRIVRAKDSEEGLK